MLGQWLQKERLLVSLVKKKKPSGSSEVIMADKLPKVSIAVVGVVIAQIGGFIWWTAQQASTIQNLEETVNVLTVENNATDRTNLIRDVEEK